MADFPIDVVIKSDKAKTGGKQAENAILGVDAASQRTLKTLEQLNATLLKVNGTLEKSSGAKKTNSELEKTKKQLSDANKRLKEFDNTSKQSNSTLISLSNTLKLVGAGFIAMKLTQQAKEAATLSQRYNELGISLTTVGRNTGQTRQFLDDTVKSLEGLGISMLEARQTVLRLASSQIDLAKAEELADLARNAAIVGQLNTSEALERITFGVANASLVTLRSVGIVTTFDAAYKELAAELGINADQLSESEKQQARLNAVLAKAPALTGLYEEAMNNAGKQLRSTDRLAENLKVQIGGVFDNAALLSVGAYTDLLKELTKTTEELVRSGNLEEFGNKIARAFAIAGDVIGNVLNLIIRGNDLFLVTLRQIKALASGDLAGAQALGAEFLDRVNKNVADVTSLNDKLDEQIDIRKELAGTETGALKLSDLTNVQTEATTRLVEAEEKLIKSENDLADAHGNTSGALDKAAKARADFVGNLSDEQEQIGKTSVELRKMQAERLGLGDSVNDLIDDIDRSSRAFEEQEQILKEVADVTEQFKSSEQELNEELARLEVLLQNGLGWQEYQAAVAAAKGEVEKVDETLNKVEKTSEVIFGKMSQFGIRAARSIQSAFSEFLFDPFKDGLDGMFKNFANVLRKMLAEIAASGILNGVASIFNGGSFGSGFSNTLGLGGVSNLVGRAGGGLGIRSNTSQFSNTGGAGTAFIGGPGTALGGTGTSGASTAVSSLLSAGRTVFAGLSGAAIGIGIGSSIAGDKEVFGASGTVTSAIGSGIGAGIGAIFGPLGSAVGGGIGGTIGGAIASIFGRGPLKQQETRLLGDVSLDSGFEGALNTRFQAKGGLLRGGKTDNVLLSGETGELLNAFKGIRESGISGELREFAESAKDTALTIDTLLDKAIIGMGDSLRDTADVLGLNADLLDGFSTTIDLAGADGEPISAEAINQAISDVGDHMANVLLPGLENFRQGGETATEALSRIVSEFVSLEDALIVFGVSAEDAQDAIGGLSISTRSELVEMAGGFEALNEKINFFASNFLTDSEQLDIATSSLNRQLTSLGVATDISVEDFKALVISVTEAGGISTELANDLLDLAPAFKQVRDAEEALAETSDDLSDKLEKAESTMAEFALTISTLEDAAVFGVISNLADETKAALITAAGGFDEFLARASFFVTNFGSTSQQVAVSTGALEQELKRLGLSTDITVNEFGDLVVAAVNAGAEGAALANDLLVLAPALFAVRNAASSLSISLTEQFAATAASDARIRDAREALTNAENQLAVEAARGAVADAQAGVTSAQNELSRAQKELSAVQGELSAANSILSEAKSNLSAAEQELSRAQAAAVQQIIDERSALISSYEEEANALRGLTNRFDNLADKLIAFRDSLATSDLSPFGPGEQLAITRQRFESTLSRAQGGDADAIDQFPQVADDFLRASQTFNGATDAFKADFDRVQNANNSLIDVAKSERDIAQETLNGVEATIAELQRLNEETKNNGERILSVAEATQLVQQAQGEVAAATANVASINGRIESAQGRVESATNGVAAAQERVAQATQGVQDATLQLNGGLTAIEQATKNVADLMFELGNAILQGFGNLAISDQQIRDFLAANPQLSVQQIIDIAIQAGVSGSQVARATNTPIEDINRLTGGRSVPGGSISDFVNANLNNPMAIVEAAKANGVSRQQLADNSVLTLDQIDRFVRDNNIAGFMQGTDRVPRTGLAFIHENESIGPSTMPAELQAMRALLADLIIIVEEQTEQLVFASERSSEKVVSSTFEASENAIFERRSSVRLR